MDAGYKAWPLGQGRQDLVHRGDLPPLPRHEGGRDRRQVPRHVVEGRVLQDYACSEAVRCRTAYSLQGLYCRGRLKRPHWLGHSLLFRGGQRHPRLHRNGQALRRPCPKRILGQQGRPSPHGPKQAPRPRWIRSLPYYPGPSRIWLGRCTCLQAHACSSWHPRRLHMHNWKVTYNGQLYQGSLLCPPKVVWILDPGSLGAHCAHQEA